MNTRLNECGSDDSALAGRHRRQALRLPVEERVDRVAQAVGIDRVRVRAGGSPSPSCSARRDTREARESRPPVPASTSSRTDGSSSAESIALMSPNASWNDGHLDARRVPELRPDRIEHRVPELVAEHVGALARVDRDAAHRRVEEAQFLAVVVRVQILARVEIDDERPADVPAGGVGQDAAPVPHGSGQRVGGVPVPEAGVPAG